MVPGRHVGDNQSKKIEDIICPSHHNKLIIPTSMQVIQYICVHGAVPMKPEIISQTQSLKTKGKKKEKEKKMCGAVVEET
jgi:hypothetical protein